MGSPRFPWLGRKGGPPTLTKKNGEGGVVPVPQSGKVGISAPQLRQTGSPPP